MADYTGDYLNSIAPLGQSLPRDTAPTLRQVQPTQQVRQSGEETPELRQGDTVEVSQLARMMYQLKTMPEVRSEVLESLQTKALTDRLRVSEAVCTMLRGMIGK
jgi:hypothetical protein